MKRSRNVGSKLLIGVIFAILLLYTISILYTIAWGLLTSLKSDTDFSALGNAMGLPNWKLSEREIKLYNYTYLLQVFELEVVAKYYSGNVLISSRGVYNLPQMIIFSLIYCGGGCIVSTIVPCMVAYLVTKFKCAFSKIVYGTALLVMALPIVGSEPARLALLRNLRLYDTFWGELLMKSSFLGMYFFVFTAFFEGLSDTYAEAAEIDGASQFKIMTSVIFPIAGKTIATVMLVMFITLWDDYRSPLLYLPTKPTLAYAVYELVNGNRKLGIQTSGKIAGCMLLAVPVLIIFICLKDRLMGNVTMGGLKE